MGLSGCRNFRGTWLRLALPLPHSKPSRTMAVVALRVLVLSQEALVIDRRRFLSTAASGLAAVTTLRGNLVAQLASSPSTLPDSALFDKNEDAYWAEMRKQFFIPESELYLNKGMVGSSPAPVLRAIFEGYSTTERMDQRDPEDYPIWGCAAWN